MKYTQRQCEVAFELIIDLVKQTKNKLSQAHFTNFSQFFFLLWDGGLHSC